MSKNGKTASLVAAALLLSGLVLVGDAATDVRAESAYPNVGDLPAKPDKPSPITVDEQSKLKKELNDARDRQNSQVKGGDGAGATKIQKALTSRTFEGDRQAFPAARLRKLNPTKQQLAWPKDISCDMKNSLRSRACAWVFRMLRDERCDRKPSIAVRTVV